MTSPKNTVTLQLQSMRELCVMLRNADLRVTADCLVYASDRARFYDAEALRHDTIAANRGPRTTTQEDRG